MTTQRQICISTILCGLLACGFAFGQDSSRKPTFDQTVAQVIDAGKAALYKAQSADGSWPGFEMGTVSGGGNDKTAIVNGVPLKMEIMYPVGPTALAVYALLEAGESPKSKPIAKALEWLAAHPAKKTYELGLVCNVWVLANNGVNGKFRKMLERDAGVLRMSTTDGSYSYDCGGGGSVVITNTDNSNSQYGLLGVWAAARSLTYEVPEEYWKKVRTYWTGCQNPDGGWGYRKNDPPTGVLKNPTTGSMTTAGLASLFVCYDNLSFAGFVKCESTEDFKPVQRGLEWFDKNFDDILGGKALMTDPGTIGDIYYFLYGVERVGLASGYKYFGTSDWYRLGAQRLLDSITNDGWRSNTIMRTDVPTAYAMLFLVRGRNAVLFNKLQFTSAGPRNTEVATDWNCRPRDLATLCAWLGRSFETTVNWQIINLKVPVSQWHDAPILYISGSREPKFTDQDIAKLRAYALQGGTILSCTECNGGNFRKGIREVYKKMFPEYELVALPTHHDLFTKTSMFELGGRPKFQVITNGIRPLVIHADEDMPRSWQLNTVQTERWAFQAAANVFMYLSDHGKLRTRASFVWPDEVKLDSPKGSARIVRLRWKGNWNPEPLALERFSRLFRGNTQIDLTVAEPVDVSDVAKAQANLAVLSGQGEFKLSAKDIDAMKDFVAKGGTVLVEPAGGDEAFAAGATDFLQSAYGVGSIRRLTPAAAVYNVAAVPDGKIDAVRYRTKTYKRAPERKGPALQAVMQNDQPAIFFSREDISNAGLVGYQSTAVDGYDPGNDVEGSAYRIMQNILFYAIDRTPKKAETPTSDKAQE